MRITIGLKSALLALLMAAPARADRRTLIRAYEYMTQPKDNLELEVWNDVTIPEQGGGLSDSRIRQRVELEYGITDHWDLALYHVFDSGGPRAPSSQQRPGFAMTAWQLETRYRFAERGVLPVDVMLYFEIERPTDFDEPFKVEEKLILERSFGKLAFVSNLVAEQHLFRGDKGYELELDLGARYEIVPQLRVGGEFWITRELVSGKGETQAFAGPTVSVATPKFWFQIGAGFGLEGVAQTETTAFVRSVLGFNL